LTHISEHCQECKNYNSMFAIISGLGHGSVSRLKLSWEKLPAKYIKLFEVRWYKLSWETLPAKYIKLFEVCFYKLSWETLPAKYIKLFEVRCFKLSWETLPAKYYLRYVKTI